MGNGVIKKRSFITRKKDLILFRIGVAIMINVWDYSDAEEVIIECVDGETIKGEITSIDDEEDSGLGEDGISIFTTDGRYLGIAQSEIRKIQEL